MKEEVGKKLQEEVICSHVCNFMIHDLIVIADVAQFFFLRNPLCVLLLQCRQQSQFGSKTVTKNHYLEERASR